jgi:hypothetical protein
METTPPWALGRVVGNGICSKSFKNHPSVLNDFEKTWSFVKSVKLFFVQTTVIWGGTRELTNEMFLRISMSCHIRDEVLDLKYWTCHDFMVWLKTSV